jgi:hypothetical protein
MKTPITNGPWHHGRRTELDSGEGRARSGRERAEETRVITWCSILRVGWGGGAIGEGAQQCPGSKAARSSASVNLSAEEANSWLEKSQ